MAIEQHGTGTTAFHTTSDFVDCPNCGGIIAMVGHPEGGITACACGWLAERGDPDSPDAHTGEIVDRFNKWPEMKEENAILRNALVRCAEELEAELERDPGVILIRDLLEVCRVALRTRG